MAFVKTFLSIQRNQIILAILLAIISGFYGKEIIFGTASIVSDIYIRFLKLISLPVIFLSITSTLSSINCYSEVKQLGSRVMGYTIITTLIAAFIGLALFVLFNPTISITGITKLEPEVTQGNYKDFLMTIVPANFIEVFLNNNVIGVMIIAFFLGFATLHIENEKKAFLKKLFSSLFDVVIKITEFILKFIPLAIWAFVTIFIRDQAEGIDLNTLGLYFSIVLGANFIQALIVLPLLLKAKGLSPIQIAKGYMPALSLAFFTKSSTAALPTTIRCAQQNLNLSKRISNFSLPLCVTCNMNACAAFILITTLFVASSNGVNFTGSELIGWALLATLAAIGNAGVPMGCYFLTTAFLSAMNVPLHIMGLILPLYAILDMVETAVNVWSDGVITATVEKDINAGSSSKETIKKVA